MADKWVSRIQVATTSNELNDIAAQLKTFNLPSNAPERQAVMLAYKSRQVAVALLQDLNRLSNQNKDEIGKRLADSQKLLSDFDFRDLTETYKEYCSQLENEAEQQGDYPYDEPEFDDSPNDIEDLPY